MSEAIGMEMTFGSALTALKMGHSVRRESWPAGVTLFLDEERTVIEATFPDTPYHEPWTGKHSDILATDWRLVD